MGVSEDTGKGIIAERLDRLFAAVTAEGKPYSQREVVDGINAQAASKVITYQYLSQLRSGEKRHPSLEKLQSIARWFGVSASYFIDSEAARRTNVELRLLALMRDSTMRDVAFLAKGLGPEELRLVIGILDLIRKAEGLPPVVDG